MKKLSLLFALIAMTVSVNAQSSNGLIAHWNFIPTGLITTSVPDISGNGFNGTINAINFVAGRTGKANTAALFNGTNSYITTPYQSKLNITKFSICTQIKVNGFYTGTCQASMIISRGAWPTTGSFGLQYFDNAFDNDCSSFDTNKYVFSVIAGNANPLSVTNWQYTPTVRSGSWYNVVATFDGAQYNVYVEGKLINTVNVASGSIGSSTIPMTIGRNLQNGTAYPYWFNGIMDDLRVYDRVLSKDEIEDYYDQVYINQSLDTLCVDQPFNLNYATIGSYPMGNIFTAQLSDANGSFANPTNIGSTAAQTSGIISCTIPSSVTSNTGYAVRIVTSQNSDTSDFVAVSYIHIGSAATATITALPGANVGPYTPVTFQSTTANVGNNPTYQWRKNGVNINGANSSTYSAISAVDFNSGDDISLFVTGNIACTSNDTATSNSISINVNLNVNSLNATDNIAISPNPSNGIFTINGRIPPNEKLYIQVLNTLGQIVYRTETTTQNGTINQTIVLPKTASGPHRIHLKTGMETKTIPIQIQ